MKSPRLFLIIIMLMLTTLFCACSQKSAKMQDGYYTAEASSFDPQGWKEYLTVYISDNKIVTVEYDAYNVSGFVRSWDINYMRIMKTATGTYPNEFARTYAIALINWQNPAEVDVIPDAAASHASFQLLAEAAINQAKKGDKQVILVELPESRVITKG